MADKHEMPALLVALGKATPHKGGASEPDEEYDEPEGEDADGDDEGYAPSESEVNAAGAVREAFEGGDDKELARALCGFIELYKGR